MKKQHIFFILFFGLLGQIAAQPLRAITYETKLETADNAVKDGDYYNAIEWFGKAYDETKDLNLQVAMADIYVLARDYKRAESIYSRILKRDRTKEYEDLRPALGNVYKVQGKFTEAIEQYNIVLADPEVSDSIKIMVASSKAGIDNYEKYEQNLETGISYIKGKVNSGSAESAPAFGPDGSLYYSSFNARKEVILDGKEGDYHAKIYKATINDKGEFDKPEKLNELINRPGFHHGGVSFSRDGRLMYFTRATLNANGISESRIMVSTMKGGGWGAPVELDAVNGDFINRHPIEGELFGNTVLFFSSNRPGGYGGDDIYYSERKGDGTYSSPVNLGEVINTKMDEISPFYKQGVLYYSTNGKMGLGGFDIYYSEWNGSTWTNDSNIGFQYNTTYDDMFLRFDLNGTNGYLVSNRPDKSKLKMKGNETCCDDIYAVGIKELVVSLFADVVDGTTKLSNTTIEVYDLTLGGYPDSKTNPNTNDFNFPLEAERSYRVVATKDGYYPDTVTFNTVGIVDDYIVKKTFKLKSKPPEADLTTVGINQSIRLNNIYYELDKTDILPESEEPLGYLADLMVQYPAMIIELSSHTDAQGTDSYNLKLSQRRSESAKKWLVDQGIEDNRINPVGYGETVILNRCVNGVRCTDDEHRLNRRTEFKIIGGVNSIQIKKDGFDGQASPGEGAAKPRTSNRNRGGKQSFDGAPILTFDAKTVNIGKVKKGIFKEVVFNFTNDGDSDLIIELVSACTCTEVKWSKEPVKPGEKGKIVAIFDTRYQSLGAVSKTLDIMANAAPSLFETKIIGELID